jgi:arylsulfatase A-like enzyme
VVLVSLDTTRADHLGFYGNPAARTPNLDALAAEAIVFDDLLTVVPTTLASHTSLFTGNYPHAHGVPRNGFVVDERNVMLAELLAERGFTTAGFIGAFPLAARFGFSQGFDHWDEQFSVERGGDYLEAERRAEAVTDAALGWLDGAGVPEQLFLFVHYFDPHTPYNAPPPFDTLHDPRGREGVPSWHEVRDRGLCREPVLPEVLGRLELQYASEVAYLDRELGRLFDGLRSRGVLDEAVLLVTSDHGEEFTEHPAFGMCFDHGWTTYQESVHAVGLLRLPGAAGAGRRVPHLVATIDLFPTLLDLLRIPHPPGIDGRSFDPLDTRPPDPPERFVEATKPWREVETDPRWANMLKPRAIRRGRYKLVQVPYLRHEALYDLEADPHEQVNLLLEPGSVAPLAAELRTRLEAWAASAAPLPSRFLGNDPEAIEKLKALGYLGDE